MDYVKVAVISDFNNSQSKTVKLIGRFVAVVKRAEGDFFAIEASCKHQGADLFSDYAGGNIVVCPRHKWRYDLTTGQCLTNDTPPLRRYGIKVEGENILISLTPPDSLNP